MKLTLYAHVFMREAALPPMPSPLTYVVAGNGVHLWAKREGLEVLIPVHPGLIRGLEPVSPFVRLDGLPPVDRRMVEQMLLVGASARGAGGVPVETLFFLSPGAGGWELVVPPQRQGPTSVEPLTGELDEGVYSRVLIEVHTHPGMPAFFSETDDRDERGFRLYGVIGNPQFDQGGKVTAELRLRVVIYDPEVASYEFPASGVLSLPAGARECTPLPAWAHRAIDESVGES